MTPDPSAILGVATDADPAAVRTAYRKRALEHHPDRGGSTAAMAQVNAAYAWLRDPARRAARDGAAGTGSGDRSPRASSGAQGETPRPARAPAQPTQPAQRRAPVTAPLHSPQLASRWSQWVATLAALAVLAVVGLLGGSGAVSVVAALLVLRVVADERPVGVRYWPAHDTREMLETVVWRVVRRR